MTTFKTIRNWWYSKSNIVERITAEPGECGIRATHGQCVVSSVFGTFGCMLCISESPTLLPNIVGLAICLATYYITTHVMRGVQVRKAIRTRKVVRKAA